MLLLSLPVVAPISNEKMNVLEPTKDRGYLSIGDHGLYVFLVCLILVSKSHSMDSIGNLRTAALVSS